MPKKKKLFLYISTHAIDDLEKAATPFVMANSAMKIGVKAAVALQGPAIYLAWQGFLDTIPKPLRFPEIKLLVEDFLNLGGDLFVCVNPAKDLDIVKTYLINGATAIDYEKLTRISIKANSVFSF